MPFVRKFLASGYFPLLTALGAAFLAYRVPDTGSPIGFVIGGLFLGFLLATFIQVSFIGRIREANRRANEEARLKAEREEAAKWPPFKYTWQPSQTGEHVRIPAVKVLAAIADYKNIKTQMRLYQEWFFKNAKRDQERAAVLTAQPSQMAEVVKLFEDELFQFRRLLALRGITEQDDVLRMVKVAADDFAVTRHPNAPLLKDHDTPEVLAIWHKIPINRPIDKWDQTNPPLPQPPPIPATALALFPHIEAPAHWKENPDGTPVIAFKPSLSLTFTKEGWVEQAEEPKPKKPSLVALALSYISPKTKKT